MNKKIVNLFLMLISAGIYCNALNQEQKYKVTRWGHKTAENIVKSLSATTQKFITQAKKKPRIKEVTNPRDQFFLDIYAGKRVVIPVGAINEVRTIKLTKAVFNTTPLMAALLGGYVHVMDYLLKNGANPNKSNKDGLTALHLAARAGFTSAVQKLFDFKADSNVRDKAGMTPLMYAVIRNKNSDHLATIKLLLKYGADVDLKNNQGKSALNYAQAKHDEEVIQLLKPRKMELDHDKDFIGQTCPFGVPIE